MTAAIQHPSVARARRALVGIDIVGPAVPLAAMVGMYLWLGLLNSNAFSYVGLQLILGSAVPLVYAAIAQSFVIALGDIDLGVGFYVGLANAVVAIRLAESPVVGAGLIVLLIVAYAAVGAVVSLRNISSITFTLGASFVWLGFARIIAPTPRASAPTWLGDAFSSKPPVAPLPVWLIVAAVLLGYVALFRTRPGLVIRAAGSNRDAFVANGGSMVKARLYGYGFAGIFGVLAAVALTGVTRSADVTASADYTLLSIAAVIVGGGAFTGGRVSALGSIAGAMVFSVITALMTQLNVESSLQVGARGVALVLVIAGRRFLMERLS